jgi:serine/threonine-protein kinase
MEGKILGNRYELLEKIGGGGMAIVYKARCNLLNRFVAVKILRNEFNNDEEFVKRFRIEAQAAASLSHPNIVSVYDVGREGDLQYIVMELIDGITLKDYIDNERTINWREAINISIQICSAIEHAHKNQIVHRDIKPHNILLTKDGVAKVADFGIARAVTNTTITMVGSTIGSVHYFSPEQARGGYADEKSDLYSLGITLYEMTTGVLPFDGETPVAIALKHLQQVPKAPIEIDPNIPRGVNDIIMKAARKDQNTRYQNAHEMLDDLYKVLRQPEGGFVTGAPFNGNSTMQHQMNNSQQNTMFGNQNDFNTNNEKIGNYSMDEVSGSGFGNNYNSNSYPNSNQNYGNNMPYGNNASKTGGTKLKKSTMALIGISALILAIILGVWWALNMGGGEFEVGNYKGKDYQEVYNSLKEDGFNEDNIKKEEIGSDEDPGIIISHDPTEGSKIDKDKDEITFKVSKSESDGTIPDLKNMSETEARNALLELGYEKDNIEMDYEEYSDDDVDVGNVIRTDPEAGSEFDTEEKITIYMKENDDEEETEEPEETEEATEVTVPSVTDMTLDEASTKLSQSGLTYVTVPSNASGDAKVKSQNPLAGHSVEEGSSVTLTVEDETEEPTPEPTEETEIVESVNVNIRLNVEYEDGVAINVNYTITNRDTSEVVASNTLATNKDDYNAANMYTMTIQNLPEGVYTIEYNFDGQGGGQQTFTARK